MKMRAKNNGGFMSAIVIVVVVILLAIGYFFWSSKEEVSTITPSQEVQSPSASAVSAIDQISADLEASAKVDNTKELNALDAEFK